MISRKSKYQETRYQNIQYDKNKTATTQDNKKTGYEKNKVSEQIRQHKNI